MKLIRRETLAAEAATLLRQHDAVLRLDGETQGHVWLSDVEHRGDESAWRKIAALGPSPSPDDVDAIMGDRSLTTVPPCSGCHVKEQPALVAFGPFGLCEDCLTEALNLIDATRKSR